MTTPTSKAQRRGTARPRRAAGAAPAVAQVAAAERIGVTHLTAEYWPFARTGGLGEAVIGPPKGQAAPGPPATAIMPLFPLGPATTPSVQPARPPFTVQHRRRFEPPFVAPLPPTAFLPQPRR